MKLFIREERKFDQFYIDWQGKEMELEMMCHRLEWIRIEKKCKNKSHMLMIWEKNGI